MLRIISLAGFNTLDDYARQYTSIYQLQLWAWQVCEKAVNRLDCEFEDS